MKNALILFGGVSSEHDVSVVSARSVIENTPRDKYNIILIGITKDGRWFKYDGDVAKLPDDKWLEDKKSLTKAVISPDREDHGIIVFNDDGIEKIHIGNHYFRLGYFRFTMPFAFENVLNDVSSILMS